MEKDGFLKKQLQESDPKLFAALEKNWEVGVRDWIQTLPINDGSSNSSGHLQNVDKHLDYIVRTFASEPSTADAVKFTPAELYLLSASALFHDIGRFTNNDTGHGTTSNEKIKKIFAHLGVPSYELALSLGRICEYHDPANGRHPALHLTAIDPYGEIREDFLAALLKLADILDTAFTRVQPPYLGDDNLGPRGLFRRSIRDVILDPKAQMIRSVLVLEEDWKIQNANISFHLDGKKTDRKVASLINKAFKKSKYINGNRISRHRLLETYIRSKIEPVTLLTRCSKSKSQNQASLMASGMLRFKSLDRKQKKKLGIPQTYDMTVGTIVGSMNDNCEALNIIQRPLETGGLHLAAWVVEHAEHLYNKAGSETYEPVLTKKFLGEVLEGMYVLGTGIFGANRFSYEELASQVGEMSAARVKLAARRIAILSRNDTNNIYPDEPAVWAGTTHWSSNFKRKIPTKLKECNCDPMASVKERICELGSPYYSDSD